MASAGQAQAHNSQPTHFSSPSGCRLSTCRPWYRGLVCLGSNGYSSVVTFLNIVEKVTPKPWAGPGSRLVRLPVDAGAAPPVGRSTAPLSRRAGGVAGVAGPPRGVVRAASSGADDRADGLPAAQPWGRRDAQVHRRGRGTARRAGPGPGAPGPPPP